MANKPLGKYNDPKEYRQLLRQIVKVVEKGIINNANSIELLFNNKVFVQWKINTRGNANDIK